LQREQRRLAAIVAADVVGYSRLMGADEEDTLRALRRHRRELIDPSISEFGGRVANTAGDSILIEFASAVEAVRSAVAIQTAMIERNRNVDPNRRVRFRIGINVGDVIAEGEDLLGDGVNIAARMEALCDPGGVALSDEAYRQVRDRIDLGYRDGGEQIIKNIVRPIRVWHWTAGEDDDDIDDPPPPPLPDKPSIAVLPFDNMSGDPEQEFFADGVAEDVLTALSKFSGIMVIARNSSFMFKGQSMDVRDVGRQLGVRYVLEGSVRRAGNRVRLTAQLIDCTDGSHVWADRFDGELDDIFDLQDRITKDIVMALDVALVGGEQSGGYLKRSDDIRIYEQYNKASELYVRFSRHSHGEARMVLEKLLETTAEFTPAWTLLGHVLVDQTRFGWEPKERAGYQAAIDAANQALALDPNWGESYSVTGAALMFQGQYEDAIAAGEKGISLSPNSYGTFHLCAMFHLFSGNFRTAADYETRAQRLSPTDIGFSMADHARSEFHLGNYAKSCELARRVLAVQPNWLMAQTTLVAALWQLGRQDHARALAQEIMGNRGRFSLHRLAALLPYQNSAHLEELLGPLRAAGLPD